MKSADIPVDELGQVNATHFDVLAIVPVADQLKKIPNKPGVYQMFDAHERLYVGKAKSLKNRVASYFQKHLEHPKTVLMVSKIERIEIIITRSETEALLLEQNLIKQYRPPFNIMLRDDKSYMYVYMTHHTFPRLGYARGKEPQAGATIFGPYPSAASVKQTLLMLYQLFGLRQCDDADFKQRKRPCLQHQIKQCSAPCVRLISEQEYGQDVQQALQFLNGDTAKLNEQLIIQMQQASAVQAFEKAAFFRDRLMMLRDVQAQQSVDTGHGEADIFVAAFAHGDVCIQVVTVRGGRVLGSRSYFPEGIMTGDMSALLGEFMMSYYAAHPHDIPSEIITEHMLPDAEAITQVLALQRGKKITIKHQVRQIRAEWVALAKLNAEHAIGESRARQDLQRLRWQALEALVGQSLGRVECFDISHTGGESTMASCVMFDRMGANKKGYRSYSITGITPGDDYAAMRQALFRRYRKQPVPDLLLIDGGKGQLAMAMQVMHDLQLSVLMMGVSKGEGRKAGLETLHLATNQQIQLVQHDPAFHLIQYIRDESHRFALTRHRAKRDKKRASSVLEVISGLGEVKRRELLSHFGGLQGLLAASEFDMMQVKGIGPKMARLIYSVLHE